MNQQVKQNFKIGLMIATYIVLGVIGTYLFSTPSNGANDHFFNG
ncbi:MAG: hypothetical protein RR427_06095 [Cellulosilyticaceae bacterium]